MKLTVRPYARPDGRMVHALCDDRGNVLPGQRYIEITHPLELASEITVTFVIDGDGVRVVEEPAIGAK